jgi:hypothetical protein
VSGGLEPEAAAQLQNPRLDDELGGFAIREAANFERLHSGQGAAL